LIDVLTVENDTSEKVTIENPILSNTDDEFPTIYTDLLVLNLEVGL
jgi:hypothetical protein